MKGKTEYIRLNLGITKVYLVPCDGGFLLIDTGYEADYKRFRKKLVKEGIRIDQIRHLLLTHYHDDHAGFAHKLKNEFGIPLIVQKKSIPLLKIGDSKAAEEGRYITKRLQVLFFFFSLFHRSFRYPPVIVTDEDTVVDGDDNQVLRNIGVSADILYTPGHTQDSMCVLFDDGTVFAGDAVMNFLKFTGSRYRPIYYTDADEMYSSIRRLVSAGAKTILPAHGNPYSVEKLSKILL